MFSHQQRHIGVTIVASVMGEGFIDSLKACDNDGFIDVSGEGPHLR